MVASMLSNYDAMIHTRVRKAYTFPGGKNVSMLSITIEERNQGWIFELDFPIQHLWEKKK